MPTAPTATLTAATASVATLTAADAPGEGPLGLLDEAGGPLLREDSGYLLAEDGS